jgi:hypothetical protein
VFYDGLPSGRIIILNSVDNHLYRYTGIAQNLTYCLDGIAGFVAYHSALDDALRFNDLGKFQWKVLRTPGNYILIVVLVRSVFVRQVAIRLDL